MIALLFSGLQKTSLIDFPDRIATVLFTPGCNLRCPFCYNWRLVLEPKGPFFTDKDALQLLESRKRHINAVVITGGEPALQSNLPEFLAKLKEKGFAVKLDTNGFFPSILEDSLKYLDYVALDVKTSVEKYAFLGAKDTDNFLRTIEILREGNVDYEFRTTVVPGLVDEEDILKIGELAKGAKRFAFQQFVPGDTLDKTFNNIKPYSKEVIIHFAELIKKYHIKEITLRI